MSKTDDHQPQKSPPRKGGSHDPRPGSGPLAGAEPEPGRPIEDPVLADRSNPRWRRPAAIDEPEEEGRPPPPVQSLANPDGTPNVMPPREVTVPTLQPDERRHGTPQDEAARPLDPEMGRDNLREGRGGGTPNPALAEGGDDG